VKKRRNYRNRPGTAAVFVAMNQSLRLRTITEWLAFAALVLCGRSGVAQSQSVDCTTAPKNKVQLAETDQNGKTHLQLARKVDIPASVDLEVCDADLTIKGGKDNFLRITVDFDKGTPSLPAGDYLQALDVGPETVNVKLQLPKRPRAKVLVVVPPSTPRLQLNLVRGDLFLETDRIAGERRVNVVSGHVEVLANPDSYEALHASVLWGSFHDRREGGEEGHGMVSKSRTGTGKGSIEVNVVRGSLVLAAWD